MNTTQVLLVEDTATDAALVTAYLRAAGEFSIHHVETLAECYGVLSNGVVTDVVVLDLNLPDSSGLTTFLELHERFPDTPVVILSGHQEEPAASAVREGAQDFVPKALLNAPLLERSLRYAIERNARRVAERQTYSIQQDLAAARRIQQHLLPKQAPVIEGFDVAGICRPAEATGGDFFDFIPTRRRLTAAASGAPTVGRKWDLVLADVSGHGFGPTLIMVGARQMLRSNALIHDDLGEILAITNHSVAEDTLDEHFVTMFYARLDPAQQLLTFSSAGHPSWMIHGDGSVTTLDSDGLPLGMLPESQYQTSSSISFRRGDILLLITDGTWESKSPAGEFFGRQRVFELVHQLRDKSAAAILEELLDTITRFCAPHSVGDDMTAVLVKSLAT